MVMIVPLPDPMKDFPEPTEAEGIKVYNGLEVDHWKDAHGEWITDDAALAYRLRTEIEKRKKFMKNAKPHVESFDQKFITELELLEAIYNGDFGKLFTIRV